MKIHSSVWPDLSPNRVRHALSLLLILLAGAMVGPACQRDVKTSAAVDPVGVYNLVSVDGKKTPCVVKHDGRSVAIHSGSFSINPDNTCRSKMEFTAPNGVKAAREVTATYTQKGQTLTMRWAGAGMTRGEIHGDTFTMNNEGMVLAYQK